ELAPLSGLSPFTRFQPWRTSMIQVSGSTGAGDQNFGPVTMEKLNREVDRVITCCESLEARGYQPEAFPDGYIRGYFLQDGPDFCFLIAAGSHGTIRRNKRSEDLGIAKSGLAAVYTLFQLDYAWRCESSSQTRNRRGNTALCIHGS